MTIIHQAQNCSVQAPLVAHGLIPSRSTPEPKDEITEETLADSKDIIAELSCIIHGEQSQSAEPLASPIIILKFEESKLYLVNPNNQNLTHWQQ